MVVWIALSQELTRFRCLCATDDGANLLAGYKRAANILKIEAKKDEPTPDPSRAGRGEVVAAEAALAAALDAASAGSGGGCGGRGIRRGDDGAGGAASTRGSLLCRCDGQ